MNTPISVLFKSMQKDDKKEILKFEIKGTEDGEAENGLFVLSGSIVILSMKAGGTDVCGDLTAEFVSMQRDSKKTVMKFGVKGDSEEKAQQLYRFAGRNVELSVKPSQMTIEEFREEEHDGINYTVEKDGSVHADPNQVNLEQALAEKEAAAGQEETAAGEEAGEPASEDSPAPESKPRRTRGGRKREEPATADEEELPPMPVSDDDLPF
ncbi:hypothetical protein J31TS4_18700 [Paenibacillus sp. J31TS4]|uniref:hypothetical protein n=1 Tax=Paenibacillus sp. J31TS4 TaxID=2807195 RepID=UPI001B0917C3|nr:hypothetical protein [Paenibacillus sp. J31TS4]GIP38590.1 hypothetical protein J31TS4_18700 [Paenibacillus sp. J31TS4]